MSCIFYGAAYIPTNSRSDPPFLLLGTNGNQCALVGSAHSPCALEMEGRPVDEQACPRVEQLRP